MITVTQIFDALAYAGVAQQVELSEATAVVYHDQLKNSDIAELSKAVKRWVSTYDEPYRRLPTVGELRAIMREGKSRIDPKVAEEIKLAALVKAARARGDSEEQVQALIDNSYRFVGVN